MLLKNRKNKPVVYGITGGIGSGKSVVSHILRIMGFPIYDCDTHAKELMNTSPKIRLALSERFGISTYTSAGLDRKYLASKIFDDKDNLNYVNSVVHPVVFEDFLNWTNRQKSDKLFIESAILFSSGLNKIVDHVIYVDAPDGIRLSRAVMRDGSSCEAVSARMNNQKFDELYAKDHSDIFILNDNNHLLITQILSIMK